MSARRHLKFYLKVCDRRFTGVAPMLRCLGSAGILPASKRVGELLIFRSRFLIPVGN
jgi:hypothetical protein